MTSRGFLSLALFTGGCHLIGGAGDIEFNPAAGGGGATSSSSSTGGGGVADGGGGSAGGGTSQGGGGGMTHVCGDAEAGMGELCFGGEPQLFPAGQRGFVMVVVDCDLDGDLDLAVAGKADDASSRAVVRALRNDGTGTTFTTQLTNLGLTETFSTPVAMVAAKNEDTSSPGLAIAMDTGPEQPKLRRLTFAANCTAKTQDEGVLLPEDPRDLVAMKKDADAIDDLVITLADGTMSPEIETHLSGSGAVPNSGNATVPAGITAGHFGSGAEIDIAYTDVVSNAVVVRAGNGTGFGLGAVVPVNASGPTHVVAGDVDGDDDLDLVSANPTSNSISLMRGDGLNGFANGETTGVEGVGPLRLALGDVDNDGDLDVFTANAGGIPMENFSMSLLLNDGLGGFTVAPGFPVALAATPNAVAMADFNDDGAADLVALTQSLSPDEVNAVVLLADP